MRDSVYRMPIMGHPSKDGNVTIEPNPFGDPHTVKLTLPMGGDAWVILPREMFSDEVNHRSGAYRMWRLREEVENGRSS